MSVVPQIEAWITIGLAFVAFGIELYAFVHAVLQRPDAYEAAGKRTKGFWTLVTALCVLAGFVTLVAFGGAAFGIISLVAVVGAGVYLADVKPAIAEALSRSSGW